jgi:hypothetical protein
MNLRFTVSLAVVYLVLGAAAGPAFGQADEVDEVQELRSRIAELESRLSEIESKDHAALFRDADREAVYDAVDAALADAEVGGGSQDGFFIKSADGNNLLKIRGLVMFRHIYSHQSDPIDGDEDNAGFDLARTRFGFMGHVIDPTWQYKIWTGFLNDSTNALLDVWVRKDFGDFSVTAGQFKLPFFREYLVSETSLQFIERSNLTQAVGAKNSQGLMLKAQPVDKLRLTAAVTDGKGGDNTGFNDDQTDFAFTGRGEYHVYGDWSCYRDLECFAGQEPLLVLGAAGHVEIGDGDDGFDDPRDVSWTADLTLKQDRASAFAAVVGVHSEDPAKGDLIGGLVQGGFFVRDDLELIARYEYADADVPESDDLSILTAGVNYFVQRWNLRIGFDAGYAFNAVSERLSYESAGRLADEAGGDGQVVVRSQVQLLF